jgi:transcriptional regulator with XRE-family HTH domain
MSEETFGRKVRALREQKRRGDPSFSLRQFAQRIGVSATYLSKVETEDFSPPAADKILLMAELLGVNADELLALAGKVDPALPEIIRDKPKAMADFLRTAHEVGATEAEIEKLTKKLRKTKGF